MIVLDTNIVSEPIKPKPNRDVCSWIDAQASNSIYLCTPVLAELYFGVELLPAGARRSRLKAYIERLQDDLYLNRVLAFDTAAAANYGAIAASCFRAGRNLEQMDGMIAAIALTHGATLATRNVSHFAGLGLDLINPFGAG